MYLLVKEMRDRLKVHGMNNITSMKIIKETDLVNVENTNCSYFKILITRCDFHNGKYKNI